MFDTTIMNDTRTIVVTSARQETALEQKAKQVANDLHLTYMPRRKRTVNQLIFEYHVPVLVVGQERMEWFANENSDPFFFHLNSASFRMKRILRGEHDPFLDVTELKEGDCFFDGTLGLGTDCMIAAYAVGASGEVIGVENNVITAYLVQNGLQTWKTPIQSLQEAMKRIKVRVGNHVDVLKTMKTNSVDVVYFDPMFSVPIQESNGIDALRMLAYMHPLTKEAMEEAKRVARRRIVIKSHFRDSILETYGFERIVRKTSEFHFGYLDVK